MMKTRTPQENVIQILEHWYLNLDEITKLIVEYNEINYDDIDEAFRIDLKVSIRMVLEKCAKCKGKACKCPTIFWIKEQSGMYYVVHWFCKTGLKTIPAEKLQRIKDIQEEFNRIVNY